MQVQKRPHSYQERHSPLKGTNLAPTGAQAERGWTSEGTAERSGMKMFRVKTALPLGQQHTLASPNSLNETVKTHGFCCCDSYLHQADRKTKHKIIFSLCKHSDSSQLFLSFHGREIKAQRREVVFPKTHSREPPRWADGAPQAEEGDSVASRTLYQAPRVESGPVLFLSQSLQPDPVNAKASTNERWRKIRAFCGKSHKEVLSRPGA